MAKLTDKIITDMATIAQVAETAVRIGWKTRDALCHDRHCCKCGRKDHHSAPLTKGTKSRLAAQLAKEILTELDRQSAKRRLFGGANQLKWDPNAVAYDGDEQPN